MSDAVKWTTARAEAHSNVAGRSTRVLCEVFDMTTSTSRWAGEWRDLAIVRGWVMDELEVRYPREFEAWMLGDGIVTALEAFESAVALEEGGLS